jgi:hypothetical protein
MNPSAGCRVNAEVREGRDRRGGVEMVKEAGNVKEQDAPDIPSSNGHLRFEAEECRGVWCGVIFPRTKLRGADELKVAFICAQTISNDFLEEFTCALEKRDGAISLGD